ncbi:T-complex protein 1 subunit gamma [Smittium culicis]|uniref:T-complex protein 1 subunit gamma n=1 Tax=Smittium culicis TaxID=133412 RepID=A0A1R1Y706_9FUNG|nr:T-complex protein 1 subunit gamma [Smittium culicis]
MNQIGICSSNEAYGDTINSNYDNMYQYSPELVCEPQTKKIKLVEGKNSNRNLMECSLGTNLLSEGKKEKLEYLSRQWVIDVTKVLLNHFFHIHGYGSEKRNSYISSRLGVVSTPEAYQKSYENYESIYRIQDFFGMNNDLVLSKAILERTLSDLTLENGTSNTLGHPDSLSELNVLDGISFRSSDFLNGEYKSNYANQDIVTESLRLYNNSENVVRSSRCEHDGYNRSKCSSFMEGDNDNSVGMSRSIEICTIGQLGNEISGSYKCEQCDINRFNVASFNDLCTQDSLINTQDSNPNNTQITEGEKYFICDNSADNSLSNPQANVQSPLTSASIDYNKNLFSFGESYQRERYENLDTNKQRESGPKARMSNIMAAKTIADIVRTCLGPRAMLKMMLDPMGGITLTNDGHTILRECEAIHPAAKSVIELSRTQDEEVGDGTTSVIVLGISITTIFFLLTIVFFYLFKLFYFFILAGEMLTVAAPFLERKIHPVVILDGYRKALQDAESMLESISITVDTSSKVEMLGLIKSAIGTKFVSRWNDLMCNLALTAVQTIVVKSENLDAKSKAQVDIKRFIRVEKVPGGEIEDSEVLSGVMFNKDIVHPKMRRKIANPRIILLDCPLEYKKGESQTNIEITKETEWARLLEIEEEQIKSMCDQIALLKPDLVITEKGVSDLAQHYLVNAGISAIRRIRKMDNNRIARATGATIGTSVFDLKESDVGTQCGLFEIKKIGDEYFTFLVECKDPKACTIMLRGPSKDILNEVDRNLQDAMSVARNVLIRPLLCPGGGASEMAISVLLAQNAKANITGVEQRPYLGVSEALEVIPRTLVQNCGGNAIKVLTALRAKHSAGEHTWGVNGETGVVVDMKEYGIWEPLAVKIQTIKTSIEIS